MHQSNPTKKMDGIGDFFKMGLANRTNRFHIGVTAGNEPLPLWPDDGKPGGIAPNGSG